MTEQQIASLADAAEMREAIAVVYERTDEGERAVDWADVSDALSSGQWGRLIQAGVLVGGDDGFTLEDPASVAAVLDRDESDGEGETTAGEETAAGEATTAGEETTAGEATTASEETVGQTVSDEVLAEEDGDEGWTRYDKLAGVGALLFFFGYWNTHVRDLIASVDNLLLDPFTSLLPFYAIVLLLSVGTGVYSTVLQARLTDSEKMAAYKARMDEIRERKKEAKERDDEEALERIQEEQMDAAGDQLGMFKAQFRPMVWIMLLTIPVFLWMRWKVRGGHMGHASGMVLPMAGAVGWQQAALGPFSAWIAWYFLCSIAARQIIQKTFGVNPTGT